MGQHKVHLWRESKHLKDGVVIMQCDRCGTRRAYRQVAVR